jgi:hypothetical protein
MESGAVGHNFKRDPPREHPCQVRFNLVPRFQRRRFKCESLRRTTDAKWWQKLKWPLARWAKKVLKNVKNLKAFLTLTIIICGGLGEYTKKTNNWQQIVGKLIMLYRVHLAMSKICSDITFGNKLCILWQLCYIVAVRFIGG